MKLVFDSSAIFHILKEGAVEKLSGNYTMELARYELGNILWKERVLLKRLNDGELKKMVLLIGDVLNLMELLKAEGHEAEIMDIAVDSKLTFYDASYVYGAKSMQAKLVTEDSRMVEGARSRVTIVRPEGIL